MNTTDFLANFQLQLHEFSESQKKLTELWSESQKELSESQKQLFQTWIDRFSGQVGATNFSTSVDTLLTIQQEMINSTLNAQKTALYLGLETQKQLWDSYFQITRKMAQVTQK